MKSSSLLFLVGVAVLAGLLLFGQPSGNPVTSPNSKVSVAPTTGSTSSVSSAPTQSSSTTSEKAIEATLTKRQLSPNPINVNQDDKVVIHVSSDESGEFHLTGYELEQEMQSGEKTDIHFTADKPGRYTIELHPEGTHDDVAIGALVVQPK